MTRDALLELMLVERYGPVPVQREPEDDDSPQVCGQRRVALLAALDEDSHLWAVS